MRHGSQRLRPCTDFVSVSSVKVRLAHPRIQELALSLEPGRTVIVGRAAPEVDLELNWDAHVSRWHARLWVEDGLLCVQDLGSRNGTWRGGERLIDAVRLGIGESVRIGDTLLTAADMVASASEPFDDEATQPGDTRTAVSVAIADLRLGSTDIVTPRVPPDAATVPSIPSGAAVGAETLRPAATPRPAPAAPRPPSQVAAPPFAPPPPGHPAAPYLLAPTPVAGYAAPTAAHVAPVPQPHAPAPSPAPHASAPAAASFAPAPHAHAPAAASFAPAPHGPGASSFAPAPHAPHTHAHAPQAHAYATGPAPHAHAPHAYTAAPAPSPPGFGAMAPPAAAGLGSGAAYAQGLGPAPVAAAFAPTGSTSGAFAPAAASPAPAPSATPREVAAFAPAPPRGGSAVGAPPAPAAVLRGPPGMFVTADRLDVRCAGAAEVRALWAEHLSRGGLFVETTDLRPTGTRVEVSLSTPDGSVALTALVVHAAPLSGASPAGLGLQLVDLPAQTKHAIVAYAEGQASVLATRRPAEPEADTADVDAAVSRARRLLEQLGSSDVYKVLEIAPDASDAALKERIATVARGMSSAAQHASPQKAARIEQAVLALGRLSQALGDPLRRLEHDLSRGHVRADARIAAAQAGTGPSIAELRLVWQKVAPDKVTRATQLTREAFTARQRGDLDGALRQARAALADNPFSDELRSTVADWTKSAQQGDEPLPRSPTTRGRR